LYLSRSSIAAVSITFKVNLYTYRLSEQTVSAGQVYRKR